MSSYFTFLGSQAVFHHGGGFRTASGKTVQLLEFMNRDLTAICKTVVISQEQSDYLYSQGAIVSVCPDQFKPGQMEFRL